MPNWGEILKELNATKDTNNGLIAFDAIRQKYLTTIHTLTKRAVFFYASGWLQSAGHDEIFHLVEPTDVHALMEVCYKVKERELDLIIHSPGGAPNAAEQMLNYLRSRFDYIRAIVPLQAKSAATMIALGCDEIVMGDHSELGPIDPQLRIPIPGGGYRFAPAHAILRDFERSKNEIADNIKYLPAWTPILNAYAGGLLEFCKQQITLSQELVEGWVRKFMLRHDDCQVPEAQRDDVASNIARYFGSDEAYDRFRTHSRPIRIEELQSIRGLRVGRLEDNQDLQDAVLSLYHVFDFNCQGGGVLKIVENHQGSRYVRARRAPAGTQPNPDTK